MNTKENCWNVYCSTTNQIQDETTKVTGKLKMRERFGLVTYIETKSWFFSSTRNLHFYHFKISKLCSKTVKENSSFDLSKGKIKCDLSFTYNHMVNYVFKFLS